MRFSEQWLREWVDPKLNTSELADQLTMGGLEVDAVEPVAGDFSGVVAAVIERCEPHPDADKLQVCHVNDGSEEPKQVVCGAPNARAGLRAPLAQVGGILPGNFKIKKAKLRGVESFGMLCSGKELGLGEDHDGLLELAPEAAAGSDLNKLLQLDDRSIEVDLTPNRADCLSVLGIAQDVAALTGAELNRPAIDPVPAAIDDTFAVELVDAADCPRYVGRVIRGIDPTAQSPLWMVERLRRCGVRSIGPVVDVTAYVMLELGQPMHAFDLDKLSGGIRVQRAQEGETITLLDGSTHTLTDELLICDHAGPVALAGIMGGLASSVSDETDAIFLESAWFRPQTIAGRARELGMHTDASHRYERGVDPELAVVAIERASQLLLTIAGGQAGPVTEVVDAQQLPECRPVPLRQGQVERLLGVGLDDEEIESILGRLAMTVEVADAGWSVTPPSRRFDIREEVDLIEEIARVHGFNHLPSRAPQGHIPAPELPEGQLAVGRIHSTLVERGYLQAINYSFHGTRGQLMQANESLALANPLSADLAMMRSSLLPGLLATAAYNQKRQLGRLRFFETGVVFPRLDHEILRLAGVLAGPANAENWANSDRTADFYDLKGDVEAVLGLGGQAVTFRASKRKELHPGQSADILMGGEQIGWLGALHPRVAKRADLSGPIFAFELDLAPILQRSLPRYQPISKYPSIRIDLAMIFPATATWSQICEIVQENGGNLLTKLVVFDEYKGKGISEGQRSLAFGLILQDQRGTLTDEQADEVKNQVIHALSNAFGATVRG